MNSFNRLVEYCQEKLETYQKYKGEQFTLIQEVFKDVIAKAREIEKESVDEFASQPDTIYDKWIENLDDASAKIETFKSTIEEMKNAAEKVNQVFGESEKYHNRVFELIEADVDGRIEMQSKVDAVINDILNDRDE